jgi:hypothetical protein
LRWWQWVDLLRFGLGWGDVCTEFQKRGSGGPDVGGGCDDGVMSSTASAGAVVVSPRGRLEVLFEELAELCGQRNAIDGRIVQIVAEIDRDQLCGVTGARSVPALVAWKTGCSPANAHTISTVAGRLTEFPRCAKGMREGGLSLDQVGVIAARAGQGSEAPRSWPTWCCSARIITGCTIVASSPSPDPPPLSSSPTTPGEY